MYIYRTFSILSLAAFKNPQYVLQIRSNVKTVVTQAQRIAISASTSFTATTSAKDFSAIQANEG